ncbi:hypothetical protein [Polaribacter sp. SA4-12]|uniref:hypothetical protein n=1 Tax=Polaribacter sp. SA4-12 TaxID=1312072 RepID=UPI000B3C0E4F|nr:hypothetical protein [Polaribacter sp. SA4-12]ARV15355.1 hypothetical protein BTO07_09470 [Polaribacter sp. SA4-12]
MRKDFSKIKLYKNSELYSKEWEISIKLEALTEMIKYDNKSILNIKSNFEIFKNKIKSQSIDNKEIEQAEDYLIDRELIVKDLESHKRYSSCLLIFSVLENILSDLCNNPNINYLKHKNEYKGKDDFVIYKKLLKEKYSISFKNSEPNFTKIKQQKIIRNYIAHKGGIVDEKIKSITLNKEVLIKGNKIEITENFLLYLMKETKELLKKILWEIDKKL